MPSRRYVEGFTLIELLIVVAIIAILAAIAVPNFLEAQTRAKISRVKADQRSVATALESYAVDNNFYPLCEGRNASLLYQSSGGIHHVIRLTTPVAYMTTVSFEDPFLPPDGRDEEGWLLSFLPEAIPYSYGYMNIQTYQREWDIATHHTSKWTLVSNGPDKVKGPDPTGSVTWWFLYYGDPDFCPDGGSFDQWNYDATNGTASNGDIIRWQSGPGN